MNVVLVGYVLITVNGAAEVRHEKFDSLEVCQKAAQIVKDAAGPWNYGDQTGAYYADRGEWAEFNDKGQWRINNRYAVKTAECFAEP